MQEAKPNTAAEALAVAQRTVTISNLQTEGTRKLFQACLLTGDHVRADKHRQQLHILLDMNLDAEAAAYNIIMQPVSKK